ncbi:hypothetical protein [Romboutsia sp. MSSM.1001216sp_RTP31141st1_G3_RTP31141_220114]|uniref:hypothetical protein n=1 Tax=unclassified Romboutsia TaxID=2626894 RepID=UPI0031B611B0
MFSNKYEKIVFGIMIVVIIGLIIFFNIDYSPHKMHFEEDKIRIKIDNIYIKDIKAVELLDDIPIGNKIKGTSTETYLRGTFQIDGDEKGKLYVYRNSKPYIKITTSNKTLIYNDKDSNKTIETYNQLIKKYNLKSSTNSVKCNNFKSSQTSYTQKDDIVIAISIMPAVLIFVGIGIYSFKRKTPMHFWAGTTVKSEEISNIKAYNRANGIMWISYGLSFLLIPLLGSMVGSIVIAILSPFMIVGMVLCYRCIYNKYKVK